MSSQTDDTLRRVVSCLIMNRVHEKRKRSHLPTIGLKNWADLESRWKFGVIAPSYVSPQLYRRRVVIGSNSSSGRLITYLMTSNSRFAPYCCRFHIAGYCCEYPTRVYIWLCECLVLYDNIEQVGMNGSTEHVQARR